MKAFTPWILVLAILWPVSLFAQATGDYRSLLTGAWTTATNWQMYNGTAWVTAATAPNNTNGVITIQSGHNMTIGATVTIDQVVIDAGGTVTWTNGNCVIANGTGVDLTINGTYVDSRAAAGASITFNAGATWQMGAAGNLIRTVGNSSNNWQNAYEGGIANIPATSNWIIRKTGTQNPTLSTTAPTTGSVYPNLIIENNTGNAWTMPAASSFTGTTAFATVKGNLDIGGSGSNTVNFLNNSTFATPTTVNGNVLVRAGNTLRNYGTGLRIGGDLTVNGTIGFDGDHSRLIEFNGTGAQNITNTGTFYIYNLTVNKASGAVNLNNSITIYNIFTLTSGIVNTTASALIIMDDAATVSGGSNTSFVNGPITKMGEGAFTFPVGKNTDIQPIGMGNVTPAGVALFSDDFSTGGPLWNKNVPTGAEGSDANFFDFDDDEGGVGSWACGIANNGNPTMHITSVFNPSGGAAYDAGGLCGAWFCPQSSRRCETPIIDCSGKQDIQVSFNYIENGSGTNDNATLWYFDGSTWAQVSDMPKTLTCTSGQGAWTRYTYVLPASANNNPNVQVALQWVNNDDGVGTDPSFAMDDFVVAEARAFTAEYFYSNPQIPYGNTLASPLTTLSSCEYWILDRTLGLGMRNVTLNWDANSCAVTSLSSLRVARHDGISTWQNEGNTATTGSTGAGSITSNVVTNFSPFTLADITVLPIELLEFTANYDGTNVNCQWITATELNNDFFTVERSVDGEHFVEIGRIKGAGTTNIQQQYFLPDDRPVKGISYYRLRQTDYDGAYTYSSVRPINIGEGNDLHLDYVSQNNGAIQVNYSLSLNISANITVYDMTGRMVYSAPATGNGVIILDKSSWSKGIYTVLLTNGKVSDHRKFVIE